MKWALFRISYITVHAENVAEPEPADKTKEGDPTRPYSRYYRSLLDPVHQKCYDQLVSGLEQEAEEIFCERLPDHDYERVMFSVHYDHPMLFHVNYRSFRLVTTGNHASIRPEYHMTGIRKRETCRRIHTAMDRILDPVRGKSRKEAVILLHDNLANRVEYPEYGEAPEYHNLIGPMLLGKSVCEGDALAMKALLDRCRIRAAVVIGEAKNYKDPSYEGHAWNLVQLQDVPCYLDVTYDRYPIPNVCSHAYFGVTGREMLADHRPKPGYALPVSDKNLGILRNNQNWEEVIQSLEAELHCGKQFTEVRLPERISAKETFRQVEEQIRRTGNGLSNRIRRLIGDDMANTMFVEWNTNT